MTIKGRGNSTWWQGGIWGKRPYQIKFEDKTEVLGMPEDKKWVLLAELSDPSFIRNKISRELANKSLFDYVPQIEYTELFINEIYAGLYVIGQKVEESSNRVNIGDDGYLVEIDTDADGRLDPDDVYFKTDNWRDNNVFNIKEPSLDQGSTEFDLIKDYINNFESALFSVDFKNPESGYRSFIDLPSFIDWYLINEISKNQDSQSYSSIYFNYIAGEKIKMGPIWDFDLAFGNVDYSNAKYPEGFWVKENPWFKRMFEDPYFDGLVKERFRYYFDNLDETLSKIDGFENQLLQSQKRNFQLFPFLLNSNEYVWPIPEKFNTHNGYVEHLKSWIETRMNWLNTNL
tara:strand:+ start:19 stop:1050 length:1032 start_codon:yes stop_codon:yes gene_type:complete